MCKQHPIWQVLLTDTACYPSAGSGLAVHVRQVITNEASFQRCSSAASSPAPQQGEAAQKALKRPASHHLVVEPRRAYEEGDDHGCDLCPANLCKVWT